VQKVKSAAGEEEMYNYLMSPRYFAKFSQHPKSEENWFHFSPKGYAPGSPELKLYVLKVRIINFLKKPFTR
jgi:hypothetical protein